MPISIKLKKLDEATLEVEETTGTQTRRGENFDKMPRNKSENSKLSGEKDLDNLYQMENSQQNKNEQKNLDDVQFRNKAQNELNKDENKFYSNNHNNHHHNLSPKKDHNQGEVPLIKLEKLEKFYLVGGEEQLVIKGIDLEIWTGETVAILGKSGSGKSTLLNILGLLDAPTGGNYFLNGYNVNSLSGNFLATTRARTFGFIFQQFNLLPKLSVLENVIMPIRYARDAEKWANRFETAHKLLQMVEIDEQSHKLPKLLSGGQQQRVAIARSLVNQPKVIIGDEPTGALDSKTAKQIVKQIFELNRELGVTVIIVTHDEDLAYKCGRVIRLVDGLIVDENTPLESSDE
jgi:putative ABC transport system ATP-binding protein